MEQSSGNISESAARAAGELRVVFTRLRRRLWEVADTQDLTPSQLSALSRLSKDGPMSASELAAAERVRPQSTAATLAVLDQRGLIQRHPDPEDGRRQLVTLTELGREYVAGSRQAREEWLARALQDHCTEDERRTVIEALTLLDRLAQS
ncbi:MULTISPECIES: MarR family winged helix-turn-helix transcriptional regulator [Kitasatospora]|uniref:MarR family winged helix-turn-helix transcriptional regulator n=1 Tax=Kitasatospora TaxID=2063 RepID=UPI0031E092FE